MCLGVVLLPFFIRDAMLRYLGRFAPSLSHKRIVLPQEVQALLLRAPFDRYPQLLCYTLPMPLPVGVLRKALSYNNPPIKMKNKETVVNKTYD